MYPEDNGYTPKTEIEVIVDGGGPLKFQKTRNWLITTVNLENTEGPDQTPGQIRKTDFRVGFRSVEGGDGSTVKSHPGVPSRRRTLGETNVRGFSVSFSEKRPTMSPNQGFVGGNVSRRSPNPSSSYLPVVTSSEREPNPTPWMGSTTTTPTTVVSHERRKPLLEVRVVSPGHYLRPCQQTKRDPRHRHSLPYPVEDFCPRRRGVLNCLMKQGYDVHYFHEL